MTDFAALIRRLSDAEIDFILIGGVAATVHGSARLTRDVDVVYRRHPENIQKPWLGLIPTCAERLKASRSSSTVRR